MWKTLCYEISGSMKEDTNTPCQDKTISIEKNGVKVICLSSGDVSSKVSHFGADFITQISSEYFCENFDLLHSLDTQDLKLKLYTFLHENITKRAVNMNVNFTDLAATISLVAVKGEKYISCYLGDGVIVSYKEKRIRVVFSNANADLTPKYVTSENALGAFKIEVGLLKGINGFVLLSSGAANGLHFKHEDSFAMIVGELIKTTGSVTETEMFGYITQVFENFVIHKTSENCSIVVMSAQKSASRYYSLSNEDKISFLKLSSHDNNSLGRVIDLDNILFQIDNGKSVGQLAEILNISETVVKRKLQILIDNNILSLNSANIYKKIN